MGARGTSPVAPGAGTAGLGGALPALPGCNRYLRNNHHRVFLGLEVVFFYPFASGFSVAASYLFLCFSLVVFQSFLLFEISLCNHQGFGSPGAGTEHPLGWGNSSFFVVGFGRSSTPPDTSSLPTTCSHHSQPEPRPTPGHGDRL